MITTPQTLMQEIQKVSKKYGFEVYTDLILDGYYLYPLKENKKIELYNNKISSKISTVKEFEILLRKQLKKTFELKPSLKKEYKNSKFFHIIS
jgi:hypothetical protein